MKDIKDVPWLPNGALPGGIYLMGPLIEKPDVRGPVAEVVMGGRTYYIRHTGSSLSPSQREELEKWVAKRIGLKPAEILVQAIIDPYHTTSEGQLIRALSVPWKMIVKELQNDWSLAFKISPRT